MTTDTAQHTPGPWVMTPSTGRLAPAVWIISRLGQDLSAMPSDKPFITAGRVDDEEDTANARRIVLAVNCHDDLLEACREAVDAASHVIHACEEDVRRGDSPNPYEKSSPNEVMADCYAAMNFTCMVQAAIAKAEGKPTC